MAPAVKYKTTQLNVITAYIGKRKGNADLYSTSKQTPLTRSDIVHTVLPANNTIPAFTRKHSPGGATTHIRTANA